MSEIILKPKDGDFRAGNYLEQFLSRIRSHVANDLLVTLDLSDVVFMDSLSNRAVFDLMPDLYGVIPPRDKKVIERYNDWLDSKKGLAKNNNINPKDD